MRHYVEAYDADNMQILGNLDGQTVLHARDYRRTARYKAMVNNTLMVSNRVAYWRIVDENGNTIEVIFRRNKIGV